MPPRVVDIPDLLKRLDIEAQRRGKEHWACCPLPGHDERTPSFQIRDDPTNDERHGRWRCLGSCHTGGSPVGLVCKVLGLKPREAMRWLEGGKGTDRLSLDVELVPALARARGFALPGGVELAPLADWPTTVQAYVRSRGIDDAQAERWGIGYAIGGKLAGRIVLPWRDGKGRLVGYTARTFIGGPKKYLEPGADEGADRSAIYGEEHWPAPGQREVVVVTEGAFDGYAVERASGLPFGALAGSQLLPGHVARLSTWEEVVIASDPDKAGKGLAQALHEALVRWVRVRRAILPAGYDACKLERTHGALALCRSLGCVEAAAKAGADLADLPF